MTLKDLLNRVNEEDIDKMLIWSDWQGWANLHIIIRENDIISFWCRGCKKAVYTIYKDKKGNSYCDNCKSLYKEV